MWIAKRGTNLEMQSVNKNKEYWMSTIYKTLCPPKESYEVAIVEDNRLLNLVLSKELHSSINELRILKDFSIKLSSFYRGTDFLTYLKNRKSNQSKLIVFSDFYLEEEMNGAEILKQVKQRDVNSTVVIMSDTKNRQTSIDTINSGAHCFLSKDNKTPFICSMLLFQFLEKAG